MAARAARRARQGLIRDAIAAYDFAVARYAPARIVLWGESLGTAVAIALAAERKVGGLMLDAPFTSAADVGAAVYPFMPVRWLIKDTVPLRSAHRPRQRADADTARRTRLRRADCASASGFLRWRASPSVSCACPTAGHEDLDEHGAAEAVKEFLAQF